MRSPRGFGRCYFSLSAILAYAVVPKLLAEFSSFGSALVVSHLFDDEEEDPPPDPLLEPICTISQKPCHCNCYFRTRTLLLLKLVRHISKCNCKCRFFSFRRSGTHPPVLSI